MSSVATCRSRQSFKLVMGRRNYILALLAVLIALAACSRVDPVVKVGLVAPFEGRHRAIGYDAIYSARLAVREINAAGGIDGSRVALIALDDGGSPDLARQTAAALALDPGVVAVVGHGLPETTQASETIYAEDHLPFLALGEGDFAPSDPAQLAPEFLASYEAVTPFDETAGPYAAPTYAAFQQLWQILDEAQRADGRIARESAWQAFGNLKGETN